ncbi:MAG: VanZ family protein [Chloroflexi bacterium]|nr:VanZ family protein [Chloroflexota bacterium]
MMSVGATWVRWLPVVAWMGLITYWSGQSTLPIDQPWLARLLRGQQHPLAHAAAFAILAVLVRWAVDRTPGATLSAFLFASAFGAVDEWHQSFTPRRQPDIKDLFVDALAAAVAVMIADACLQIWRAWRAGRWNPASVIVPTLALMVTVVIAFSLLPARMLPSIETGRRALYAVERALPEPAGPQVRRAARATAQVARIARDGLRDLARLAADTAASAQNSTRV